jgi:hypothetical protein
MLRSHGSILRVGETDHPEERVNTCHTKDGLVSPVGVHLRHPWAETVDLPYNGPIDEFVRKRVRNDYTLLGLWECGIRRLRVPLGDLEDERTRARIQAMTEIGHRFNFFCVGTPSGPRLEVLRNHRDLVDAFEIVLPWRDADDAIGDLLAFREQVPVPLYLAKIESSVERERKGPKFSHYVSHGFRTHDTVGIDDFYGHKEARDASDGFVFQVGADESPWDAFRAIDGYAGKMGFRALANVRLASEDPAEYMADDLRVANRVAESVVGAAATANVEVFVDTFMDLDRGYFPRVGLYDRRLNRRLGSYVLAHLQGVLNDYGPDVKFGDRWESSGWHGFSFETARAVFNLFLPLSGVLPEPVLALDVNTGIEGKSKGRVVNLASGSIIDATLDGGDRKLILDDEEVRGTPILCVFEK